MKKIILQKIYLFVFVIISVTVNAQWENINSGTSQNLYDIDFVEGGTNIYLGYAVGTNRNIFRTENGVNWDSIATTAMKGTCPSCTWKAVDFFDTLGYTGGTITTNYITSLKTSNSGYDWTYAEVFDDFGAFNVNDLYFRTKDSGFAVGNLNANGGAPIPCVGPPCLLTIYKTFNGSNTWVGQGITISYTSHINGNAVFFPNKDTGYVVANNGRVARTVNKGGAWTEQVPGLTPDASTHYKDVYFNTGLTGCVVGAFSTSGIILCTSNGGTTWDSTIVNDKLNTVYMLSDTEIYAAGENGAMYHSMNFGVTWTKELIASSSEIRSVKFVNNNTTGYAVGDNGLIVVKNPPAVFKVSYSSSAAGNICEEAEVTFTNLSVFANQFQWYINDSLVSNNRDLTYTFNSMGTYDVKLVGDSLTFKDSSTATINVIEDPDPIFIASSDTITKNNTVVFTNTTPSLNSYQYKWYVDGIQKSTQTNYTYLFTDTGLYEVKLRATGINNCEDEYSIQIKVNDSIISSFIQSERLLDGEIKIFPNPSEGSFDLTISKINQEYKIKIFDMAGKLISTSTHAACFNSCQQHFEIKQKPGNYSLFVMVDNIIQYKSIINIQAE